MLNKNTYLGNNANVVLLHVLWPQSHLLSTAEKYVCINLFSLFFFSRTFYVFPRVWWKYPSGSCNSRQTKMSNGMEWNNVLCFALLFFFHFPFVHKIWLILILRMNIEKTSNFFLFLFYFEKQRNNCSLWHTLWFQEVLHRLFLVLHIKYLKRPIAQFNWICSPSLRV